MGLLERARKYRQQKGRSGGNKVEMPVEVASNLAAEEEELSWNQEVLPDRKKP